MSYSPEEEDEDLQLAKEIVSRHYSDAEEDEIIRAFREMEFRHCAKLAKAGDVDAITGLAFYYERGDVVPKDTAKAVELFERASQLGDAGAMTRLAVLYQKGQYVDKDETRAIELLTEAVKQDYPHAKTILGQYYYYGNGVPVNLEESLRLWEAANEQGSEEAHNVLKTAYADEAFKPYINFEKSVAYFRPLAEQGDVEAAYHLADGLVEISAWDEAKEWYAKAAESGNIDAQCKLGTRAWLEKNYADAVKWLQPIAEKGNVDALYYMANMLMTGNSALAKDEVKAFQYYEKASEQGDLRAMYQLGRCYYFGLGTAVDYTMAFSLFSDISQMGSDDMWLELGDCYREGNGIRQNVSKAIECYKQGVEKTNCDNCRMRLGVLYADPDNGCFNRSLAEEYLLPLTKNDLFRGDAAYRLGMLCRSVGDTQESVRWLKVTSDENHAMAQAALRQSSL